MANLHDFSGHYLLTRAAIGRAWFQSCSTRRRISAEYSPSLRAIERRQQLPALRRELFHVSMLDIAEQFR